ncbi:MAG: hypothetical protein K0R73_1438 [Candidatus Midichloriaceae bacterium]|jgi:hypothetical protein|nr:hypothetical protein [Candidatus Midichloriaceae bacterium]
MKKREGEDIEGERQRPAKKPAIEVQPTEEQTPKPSNIDQFLACYSNEASLQMNISEIEMKLQDVLMSACVSQWDLPQKIGILNGVVTKALSQNCIKVVASGYKMIVKVLLEMDNPQMALLAANKIIENIDQAQDENIRKFCYMEYYEALFKCGQISEAQFCSEQYFPWLVWCGACAYGDIAPNTIFIDQHEAGFSSNAPIGTNNIQNCIVLIVRDRNTGMTALAHVDYHISHESIKQEVFSKFPQGNVLEISLIGAAGTKFGQGVWKLSDLLLNEDQEPLSKEDILKEIGNCSSNISTGLEDYEGLKNIYTVLYAIEDTPEYIFTFTNVIVADGKHPPAIVVYPINGVVSTCSPVVDFTKCTATCLEVGFNSRHELYTVLDGNSQTRRYNVSFKAQQIKLILNKYPKLFTEGYDYEMAVQSELYEHISEAGIIRSAVIAQREITALKEFIASINFIAESLQMEKNSTVELLSGSEELILWIGDDHKDLNESLIAQMKETSLKEEKEEVEKTTTHSPESKEEGKKQKQGGELKLSGQDAPKQTSGTEFDGQHLKKIEKANLVRSLETEGVDGKVQYSLHKYLMKANPDRESFAQGLANFSESAQEQRDADFAKSTKRLYMELVKGNKGSLTILPENNHLTDHHKNILALLEGVKSGKILPGTVIALERKQYGANLGMKDVIELAGIISHNEKHPTDRIAIPKEIENSLIYQDAKLYKVAQEHDIMVIGIEGKNFGVNKNSKEYDSAREAHMVNVLDELTGAGRNVILSVGEAHIENLTAHMGRKGVNNGVVKNVTEVDFADNSQLDGNTVLGQFAGKVKIAKTKSDKEIGGQ